MPKHSVSLPSQGIRIPSYQFYSSCSAIKCQPHCISSCFFPFFKTLYTVSLLLRPFHMPRYYILDASLCSFLGINNCFISTSLANLVSKNYPATIFIQLIRSIYQIIVKKNERLTFQENRIIKWIRLVNHQWTC